MGKYTYNHDAMPSRLTVWSVLMFVAVSIMAGAVFHTSQSAGEIERRIKDMNSALINERQSIRVLEAEWAYLTRPQRIEELVAIKNEGEAGAGVKLVAAKKESVKKPENAKPQVIAHANENAKGGTKEIVKDIAVKKTASAASEVVASDVGGPDVVAPVPARNMRQVLSDVSQNKTQDIVRKPDVNVTPRAVAKQEVDVWPIQPRATQNTQAKRKAAPKAPSMYKPASAQMQPVGARMRPIVE